MAMTTQLNPLADGETQLRSAAITRLRRKRGLQAHVLAYVTVNLFLYGLWAATSPGGFYWPMFALLGWGIGLAFHVWSVFSPSMATEESIQREMRRLARGRGET
jgi:hypothetical protein